MRVLLLSCFLYLLGVVLVLYLKPELMFNKKGVWKEFGFSNSESHTWFPFWLFCILWAFISFFIMNYLFGTTSSKKVKNMEPGNSAKPGYYVLDREGSEREGFPRYVYLGANIPSDN
jgi:ammonia channel protein AmtB